MTGPDFPASVRQPSHIEPPFRARQWGNQQAIANFSEGFLWQTEWSRNNPTQGTGGVFSQGPGFPGGMRGVLTYLHFAAHTQSAAVVFSAPWAILGLTLLKNGARISGYRDLRPAFESSIVVAGFTRTLTAEGPRVLAPIHFDETDRLDLQVDKSGGSLNWFATLSWGGWMYPALTAGDAGSIRGTQQDPRAQHPLDRPRGW